MMPCLGENRNLRASQTKDRICLKPYIREDTTAIIPNSVDEDLNLGPDKFLSLQQERRWAQPSKSAFGVQDPSPMRPRQDHEGEVVKRTIVGPSRIFNEVMQSKMANYK